VVSRFPSCCAMCHVLLILDIYIVTQHQEEQQEVNSTRCRTTRIFIYSWDGDEDAPDGSTSRGVGVH